MPVWPDILRSRILQPAAKRAGITKRIGWHTFRHTYSSLLAATGSDVKVVQELMRHAKVSTTMEVYTHAGMDKKRIAQSRAVDVLFNRTPQEKISMGWLVMAELMRGKEDWKYGYQISRNTGLRSGTLYSILMCLAERGLMETSWEAPSEGRPPRHLYKLTQDGIRYARTLMSEEQVARVGDPAFVGVGRV